MSWIDKLERNYGKFAIPNLTMMLVVAHSVTFFLIMTNQEYLSFLALNPTRVINGEAWRLISFMFIPRTTSPIFFIFAAYILYLIGTTLENTWGHFKFNIYILIGWAMTVAVSFIYPSAYYFDHFILSTVFLAFAKLNPEFEFMLFFILPCKVKYLAWITWAMFALVLISGSMPDRLAMLAAVSAYAVFFGRDVFQGAKHGARRQQFQRKVMAAKAEPMHTCAVCGRTDRDDRYLDFRYVKRDGESVCLCEDHLENGPEESKQTVES